MMKIPLSLLGFTLLLAGSGSAAVTIAPLSSFGGDGWLSPAEFAGLGSTNETRGMAYNPASGNLILATSTAGGNLKVISGASGASVGTMDVTGITGGARAVNNVGVADDGVIYVSNLTTQTDVSPFKVYRYATEAVAPTVALSYTGVVNGRMGDSFAATGSAAGTQFVAGLGTGGAPTVPAPGFVNASTTNGTTFTGAYTGAITSTVNGDYRLGVTYLDSNTIYGTQGTNLRLTDFSGASGTLVNTSTFAAGERGLDYIEYGGVKLLATINSGTSLVTVYDVSDPNTLASPVTSNNTFGVLTANGNATTSVQWGAAAGDKITLYAMSTNQGIQAFTVTIPEPSSALLGGMALGLLMRRRRN